MSDNDIKVLEILNKDIGIIQKDIAGKLDISVGSVNAIIRKLALHGYIKIEKISKKPQYLLTEKGIDALENHIENSSSKKIVIFNKGIKKIKQAVILAAGERDEFEKPVGMLKLGSTTIIERIIDVLINYGIEKIIVVTGFESHYYEELAKSKKLYLVNNERFKWTGTMASLALASDLITDDFILIEGDMVFEERAITTVLNNKNRDCVLVTSESGSGDEVFVEIRNKFIFKMSKDKHQFNKIDGEVMGISKISIDIYKKILDEYCNNKNPYLNYEYALLDVARTYNIGYAEVVDLIWTEIDTMWQYKNLVNYIYPKLQGKENII